MKKFLTIKTLIAAIIIIKVLVLVVGSHPFDFATYVYQARSFFEYDIPALFSWNKGVPLLGYFYSQYSIYQVVTFLFNGSLENTALLHIAYKLPLLLFDIITAFLLCRIVTHVTKDNKMGILTAILWLINPFVLWSVQLHGSYAIVAAFFSVLSVFLLFKKRFTLAMLTLAVSASVYYYSIVFLPLYILKIISMNKATSRSILIAKYAGVFIGAMFLFYVPFLLTDKVLLASFTASLLHHAAPDAATNAAAIQLPNYSLLKIPYYVLFHDFPTNLTAPIVFKFAQVLTFLGALLVAGYGFWRFHRQLRTHKYTDTQFIIDMLVTVTIFLLFVGKFQNHYLLWIFPFLSLVGVILRSKQILHNVFYISFVVLVAIFGTINTGIYYLDVLSSGIVGSYFSQQDFTRALAGLTVLILLLSNLFLLRKRVKDSFERTIIDRIVISFVCVFFIFMGVVSSLTIIKMISGNASQKLGSEENVYSFIFLDKNKQFRSIETRYVNVTVPDAGFELSQEGSIAPNMRSDHESPWYYYVYRGEARDIPMSLSGGAYAGSRSFTITPKKSETSAQLNMGGGGSKRLVPVEEDKLYEASAMLRWVGVSKSGVRISLRFADKDRKIISGSDRVLHNEDKEDKWGRSSLEFMPPHGASFIEILFTVDIKKSEALEANSAVTVDNFALRSIERFDRLDMHHAEPRGDSEAILKYVLKNPTAQSFDFKVAISKSIKASRVIKVRVNECIRDGEAAATRKDSLVLLFASDCLRQDQPNVIVIDVSNYQEEPKVSLRLMHKLSAKHSANYNMGAFSVLFGLGIVTNGFLLMAAYKVIRKLGDST